MDPDLCDVVAYTASLAALIAAEAAAKWSAAASRDCFAVFARSAARAAAGAARACVTCAVVAATSLAAVGIAASAGSIADASFAELLATAPARGAAPRRTPLPAATVSGPSEPLWEAELRRLQRAGPLLTAVAPPPQGHFSCVIAGQAPCAEGWPESGRRRLNATRLKLERRLAAAEARITAGTARSGLSARVTGSPARHFAAWAAMGAPQSVLRHLRDGITVDRTESVHVDPPGTSGLNHPGATKDHPEWTTQSIDEALVLGVVEALPAGHAPRIVNPLDVVPKSGFDPLDPAMRDKLRLICDGRKGNVSARKQPFKMETLHRARHMFKRGHWMLCYDLSSGYNHFAVAEAERSPLGFQWGSGPAVRRRPPAARCHPARTALSRGTTVMLACRSDAGQPLTPSRSLCWCWCGTSGPWAFRSAGILTPSLSSAALAPRACGLTASCATSLRPWGWFLTIRSPPRPRRSVRASSGSMWTW